jgi:TetR/AcrR family transcriptional regulator, transcriptional repressor for nem operon
MDVRKSRKETAKTRKRIVAAAAAEFKEHGIVATGLADLMKAAGLTRGGFYKHFRSKADLLREVTTASIESSTATMKANTDKRPGQKGLNAAVASYLSLDHRDRPRDGCPLAAMGVELARADAKTRAAATKGFLNYVEALASQCDSLPPDQAKKRAISAATSMIGAITMARVVKDAKLSESILKHAADSILRSFE